VTVNTQRLRMGEHLKGKLEAMIHQKFDNYLRITQVLQNDIGKLAALECELQQGGWSSFSGGACPSCASTPPVRIHISCHEDGTFLVYASSGASSSCCPAEGPQTAAAASISGGSSKAVGSTAPASELQGHAPVSEERASGSGRTCQWVEQVCAFGTSGRCHSLTALFHFGHSAWKQLFMLDARPPRWFGPHGQAPDHIAEEEERLREDAEEEIGDTAAADAAPSVEASSKAATGSSGPLSAPPAVPSIGGLFEAAQQASDLELLEKALGLCDTGLQAAEEAESRHQIQQFLLLRASVHGRLRSYDAALHDAEELIRLQPTCAEGYYWQSVALQGKRLNQEAVESLMSALEYDPQNCLFQQAFTSLFEEMSASVTVAHQQQQFHRQPASSPRALHRHRGRGAHPGDALSTTTQATHLSSRSTTPTEVSAPLSRSSSNDSAYPEQPGLASEDRP